MKKQLLAASLLLSAMTSFGAGYELNLQGLRQLAMGGTGAAWPWDASTIYYNPGGLARLKGMQVYADMDFVMPRVAYGNYNGQTGISQQQTYTPFAVYIGGPIQEGSRFALGLGVYTAAGIGLDWSDQNNWSGRYLVESINLNATFIQPTISYRVSDFLSVGGGFIYAVGSFDLTNALPVGKDDTSGQAHLHGTANGVGFNLGAHLKVSDHIQVGLTYRSQVNMNISGGLATFTVPNSLASSFPNTTFETRLPLPQVATIGIGIRPTDNLTLQFDLNYTGWNSYDSLKINFATQTSALQNIHAPRHYKNTWTPRLGGCYKISKVVSVMAGAAYDPTPVPDGFVSPDLPDADRIILSCGVTVKPLPRFTVIAAFEGTMGVKRNATYDYGNFNGTYQTQAATPGIGVYYNF